MKKRKQQQNPLLEAALAISRGDVFGRPGRVLPCKGKVPLVKGAAHAATTDEATIRKWWSKWPQANIGVAMGDGLFALDIDKKNGRDGEAELKKLLNDGDRLPPTLAARTPSGGMHYFFATEETVRNSAGKIANGVDIRGEGGQVIVAPSPGYQWTTKRAPAPAPAWLLDLLQKKQEDRAPAADGDGDAEVAEGQRNTYLTSLAGRMRAAGMTPEAIAAALLAENEAKCKPPLPEDEVRQIAASVGRYPPGKKDEQKDTTVSTKLVAIALEKYELAHSTLGEPIAVPKTGPKIVVMLRAGKKSKTSLRFELAREYFARTGKRKVASANALADAMNVLAGYANDGPEYELHMRVAEHEGAIWLDMGDATGRAIRITRDGWSIATEVPVLFKRTQLSGALPEPEAGGTLPDLWHLLNVAPEDQPLLAAWLVAALRPGIAHAVLNLRGEHGSAKTSAMRFVASVIDPGPAPARKPPRNAEEFVVSVSGSWIAGLDNLSQISDWLSDCICRAATGDGDVRRGLYTDDELAVFAYRRCMVLNGIDLGALRGDLSDRLLPISLSPIHEDRRLPEEEIWPEWKQTHPRILGAVLDLAAKVLGVLPTLKLEKLPRMADFARIVAAVDRVLGTKGLARYGEAQRRLAADSLSDDLLIAAMFEHREKLAPSFSGTAAELLDRLTPDDDEKPRNWPPKGWPRPRKATERLKRHAPALRTQGWGITDEWDSHRKVMVWTIEPPPANDDPGNEAGDSARQEARRSRGCAGVAGKKNGQPTTGGRSVKGRGRAGVAGVKTRASTPAAPKHKKANGRGRAGVAGKKNGTSTKAASGWRAKF